MLLIVTVLPELPTEPGAPTIPWEKKRSWPPGSPESRTSVLMQIIGRVMNDAGKFAGLSLTGTVEGAFDWIRNPDAVEEVKGAIVEVLSAFQPKDYSPNPASTWVPSRREGSIPLAIGLARGALEAVKNPERGGTIAEWARPLRRKLGDLALRLSVDESTIAYGLTPPGADRDAVVTTLGKNPRDEGEP